MATRNTTPNKRGAQRRASRPEAAREIAEHIAAILNHPDTPAQLYNTLADAVSSLDAPKGYFDSAEYIETCLRAHFGQEGGVK